MTYRQTGKLLRLAALLLQPNPFHVNLFAIPNYNGEYNTYIKEVII